MAIEVQCPGCSGRLLVETPGTVVACPHCGMHMQAPAANPVPEAASVPTVSEPEPISPVSAPEPLEPEVTAEATIALSPENAEWPTIYETPGDPWMPTDASPEPANAPDFLEPVEEEHDAELSDAATMQLSTDDIAAAAEEFSDTSADATLAAWPMDAAKVPAFPSDAPPSDVEEGDETLAAISMPIDAPQVGNHDRTESLPRLPDDVDDEVHPAPNVGGYDATQAFTTPLSMPAPIPAPTIATPSSPTVATTPPTSPIVVPAPSPALVSAPAFAADTSPSFAGTRAPVGAGVSPTLFRLTLSYASAITLVCAYLVYQMLSGPARSMDNLDLPDLAPPPSAKGKKTTLQFVDPETEMPPSRKLRLGESHRFGSLQVTAERVTRGMLEFAHYDPQSKQKKDPIGPVLKLHLKLENFSNNQEFPPFDRYLLFHREPDNRNLEQLLTNNWVCRESDKTRNGKRVLVYDLPIGSPWNIKDQNLETDLKPGETLETYIPTEADEVASLTGPLVWRIHFRKGYNPKSFRGVTTIAEVLFSSDEIEDETSS